MKKIPLLLIPITLICTPLCTAAQKNSGFSSSSTSMHSQNQPAYVPKTQIGKDVTNICNGSPESCKEHLILLKTFFDATQRLPLNYTEEKKTLQMIELDIKNIKFPTIDCDLEENKNNLLSEIKELQEVIDTKMTAEFDPKTPPMTIEEMYKKSMDPIKYIARSITNSKNIHDQQNNLSKAIVKLITDSQKQYIEIRTLNEQLKNADSLFTLPILGVAVTSAGVGALAVYLASLYQPSGSNDKRTN